VCNFQIPPLAFPVILRYWNSALILSVASLGGLETKCVRSPHDIAAAHDRHRTPASFTPMTSCV